jgi:hypothetical protein
MKIRVDGLSKAIELQAAAQAVNNKSDEDDDDDEGMLFEGGALYPISQ